MTYVVDFVNVSTVGLESSPVADALAGTVNVTLPVVVLETVVLLVTVTDCCTCVAAFQLLFPAWFALILHVPAALKLTTPDEIEQIALVVASIVKVTGLPDPPPVAVGV